MIQIQLDEQLKSSMQSMCCSHLVWRAAVLRLARGEQPGSVRHLVSQLHAAVLEGLAESCVVRIVAHGARGSLAWPQVHTPPLSSRCGLGERLLPDGEARDQVDAQGPLSAQQRVGVANDGLEVSAAVTQRLADSLHQRHRVALDGPCHNKQYDNKQSISGSKQGTLRIPDVKQCQLMMLPPSPMVSRCSGSDSSPISRSRASSPRPAE